MESIPHPRVPDESDRASIGAAWSFAALLFLVVGGLACAIFWIYLLTEPLWFGAGVLILGLLAGAYALTPHTHKTVRIHLDRPRKD